MGDARNSQKNPRLRRSMKKRCKDLWDDINFSQMDGIKDIYYFLARRIWKVVLIEKYMVLILITCTILSKR